MKNENALSIFRPYRAGRPGDVFLGLKPQAATLWRALANSLAQPLSLAATKALRSRAESFCPFGAMAFRLGFNLASGSRL